MREGYLLCLRTRNMGLVQETGREWQGNGGKLAQPSGGEKGRGDRVWGSGVRLGMGKTLLC